MSPSAPASVMTPDLYGNLRRIASRYLGGERRNHTLQATALVHEAYLKIVRGEYEREFADESHFLAVASRIMRQVLVDYARSRTTKKRLGCLNSDSLGETGLDAADATAGPDLTEVIALDHALADLAAENQTIAKLIEMHYLAGLTAEESADLLGISGHVVRHDLRFAQAWLRKRMSC